MRENDYIIDTHSFGRPIYYDEKMNKSIWCFAKECESDNDYFYIYHDLVDDSIYSRISMNSPNYITDNNEGMRELSDNEKIWLIGILTSQDDNYSDKLTNWEKMTAIYKDECTAYGINISDNMPMPDYIKL